MPRRTFLPVLFALASIGIRATAQTVAPVRPVGAVLNTVLATTSFPAYQAFGSLAGKPIDFGLTRVGIDGDSRLNGNVMFVTTDKSWGYLNSPIGMPNGNYSVQLDFSHVSQPAVVQITVGSANPLNCAVTNASLSCSTGAFAITNGQLNVSVTVTQGYQATLSKVTINQLR